MFDVANLKGREPLAEYPWRTEIDRLLDWMVNEKPHVKAFCFDLIMSSAFIEATSGIERHIEQCDCIQDPDYNAHLGFVNLCSPCYVSEDKWIYQKAVKPQSGVLGKLSSEIILRFVENLHSELSKVLVVGGSDVTDAILEHKDGTLIFAEVKSAPLLTYPFLFNIPDSCLNGCHEKVTMTNSQLRACESAIFIHGLGNINLGKVGDDLWPFKELINFMIDPINQVFIEQASEQWSSARDAYSKKDRNNKLFYLANACGTPPKVAKERDGWPKKESISDGKTSAGMDRTDDIKKGIYQTLKIGTCIKEQQHIKTAIISNLPAYRHGLEYVSPFVNMVWCLDSDIQDVIDEHIYIDEKNLRRVFDFIITLEEPVLRDMKI